MKEPTMKEVLEIVEFDLISPGDLRIKRIHGSVWGDVLGNVYGHVCGDIWESVNGTVNGKISGREWQFVETPKERAIRLIREGEIEEAIKVLEEE